MLQCSYIVWFTTEKLNISLNFYLSRTFVTRYFIQHGVEMTKNTTNRDGFVYKHRTPSKLECALLQRTVLTNLQQPYHSKPEMTLGWL